MMEMKRNATEAFKCEVVSLDPPKIQKIWIFTDYQIDRGVILRPYAPDDSAP